MQIDKLKGTLVDFNDLEHVLDDAPSVGAWQLEIRKINDDPMELDELILHVQKMGDVQEDKLTRELNSRFLERTEIRPNRVVFHDITEMRRLLGVGVQLKEQKLVDHRPKRLSQEPVAPDNATAALHAAVVSPAVSVLSSAAPANFEVKP